MDLNKNYSVISEAIGDPNAKIHVALVYGGMSAEREVSLMTGKVLIEAFKDMEYLVTPIDMGRDIAEVLARINPDLVFNGLHGTFGEDGALPGALDILGIPYTHSGLTASAIAFNKIYSQEIFRHNGILCPKRIILSKNDNLNIEPIARPFVLKPVSQGSSIGVEIVFKEDNFSLKNYKFPFGDEIIIEEYIAGPELQVAILNNKVLGILEMQLISKKFNDYENKYQVGFSKHIYPANLPQHITTKIIKSAEKVHKLLKCKGPSRSEFIYNKEQDTVFFLEINTHPGLTPNSTFPEIALNEGISFTNLLRIIIKESLNEK